MLAGLVAFRVWQERLPLSGVEPLSAGPHEVAVVIDGDTLQLTNQARVRLLGADSPETKHPNVPPQLFGAEATEFTRQFVVGQSVRLEFDVERQDRYGRFLAYVYVGEVMLNEELIRAGLARFMPQYPYRQEMKERFKAAEVEAQTAQRGLWAKRDSKPVTGQ